MFLLRLLYTFLAWGVCLAFYVKPKPSTAPSAAPTAVPTEPADYPTVAPTPAPTIVPTRAPTAAPTRTAAPTFRPTPAPTISAVERAKVEAAAEKQENQAHLYSTRFDDFRALQKQIHQRGTCAHELNSRRCLRKQRANCMSCWQKSSNERSNDEWKEQVQVQKKFEGGVWKSYHHSTSSVTHAQTECSPKQAYRFCGAADTQGNWYKEYLAASKIMTTRTINIHDTPQQLMQDAAQGYSEDLVHQTEAVGACWQKCAETVSNI